MSHGITNKDKMFYAGEVPWHGLGLGVEEAVTSEQAIEFAGLGWEVELGPIFNATGKQVQGFDGIYRKDTGDVLGVSRGRYELFQNREMFAWTDALVQDGIARYVTAGSLWEGRKVWLLMELESGMEIAGEPYRSFLLALAGHDVQTAFRSFSTDVRVVCNNTLNASLEESGNAQGKKGRGVRVTHHPQMSGRLEVAHKTMEIMTEQQRKLKDFLEAAQRRLISPNEMAQVEAKVFDLKTPIGFEEGSLDEAPTTQRKHAIETFREIYEAEVGINQNTAYSLINTITGYADHSKRYNGEHKEENRFASIVEGSAARFKDKGLEAVRELVLAS